MKSFIVDSGAKIFDGLRWVSLFHPIRKIFPTTTATYAFVEIWVLSNFICSLICLFISSSPHILWWEIIVLSYAVIRIFEIVIYQTNVLLFDPYHSKKAGKQYFLGGYERIIILLLINYLEILVWFALIYRNLHFMFKSKHILLSSFSGSLYFSLVTMSTLGYGDITPIKPFGQILIIAQTLIGLFMVLVILARIISLLPKPGAIEETEKKGVSSEAYQEKKHEARLEIWGKGDMHIEGELIAVKLNSLLLLNTEGKDVSVDIADIRVIRIVKKSQVRKGALIGVIAIGIPLATVGIISGIFTNDFYVKDAILTALISGGIGTLIGAVTGALAGKYEIFKIEGMTDSEIRVTLDKLRKKARIRNYK